ncbi:putative monocarboxylate transporter mch1, partial [Haplosporangium bisporale]
MLASGSLYVYALYAPSFKSHLGYSQTQTSAIAVIGDLGLYGVGPLTGGLADSMGPKRASAFAGSLLLMGYGLLSYCYRTGIESIKHNEPAPNFLAMSAFLFLAGIGSSACYMAAFTTLAKSFKQGRGIAIGIPVSFFGLSAAALAFVAQKFFLVDSNDLFNLIKDKGQELDTGRFLLFLAVAGGV